MARPSDRGRGDIAVADAVAASAGSTTAPDDVTTAPGDLPSGPVEPTAASGGATGGPAGENAATTVADVAPQLVLDSVTATYGDVVALDAIDLQVAPGEQLAIVGPSGCGKSTLVKVIAGLVGVADGSVSVAGRPVAGDGHWTAPEDRGVGVVFQDHALFGHLDVADNVAFGLRGHADASTRVTEVLELVGLADKAGRYPHELSGGEQQRIALARALAPRPAVLLLDEPFSNLDRNLRERVRWETMVLLRSEGITAVFVTHDRDEALTVGTRLAVLRDGRVQQVGPPSQVYHAPDSHFVATFLDEATFVRATVEHAGATSAMTPFGRVPIRPVGRAGPVDVMVRPHEVRLGAAPEDSAAANDVLANGAAAEDPGTNGGRQTSAVCVGTVAATQFRGGEVAHVVEVPTTRGEGSAGEGDGGHDEPVRLIGLLPHTNELPVGTRVRVELDAGHPLASFEVARGNDHS